MFAINVVF